MTGEALAIASSGRHALVLRSGGSLVAWGHNDRGQLGDGTRADADEAVDVKGLEDVVAFAAGGEHSLALRADGALFAWGDNAYGQLGDGTRKRRTKPVRVRAPEGEVSAVAAGEHKSYAVLATGTVVGWGLSVGPGHLGVDALPDHPVAIEGLDGAIVAVACGRGHALALTSDGDVLLWGLVGSVGPSEWREPAPVAAIEGRAVAIAAGNYHALALTDDGRVLAWGRNVLSALGVGRSSMGSDVPVEVLGGGVVAIAAGGDSNVALMASGEILRWGARVENGLPAIEHPTPIEAEGLADVIAVAVDAVLATDGSVHRWSAAPQDPDPDTRGGAGADAAMSRLGGNPHLPAGTSWPQVDGRPLAFIAQLDLAELARIDCCNAVLPSEGLLSLFVLPADIGFANTFRMVYTEPDATLSPAEPPEALADGDRFAPIALRPEPELSLPPLSSAAVRRLALPDEETEAYELIVDSRDVPVHRVLGHPALIQTDDPRDSDPELTLLLQLDSDDANGMIWGDCGRLYVWIAADDLAARRFERAVLHFDQ